MKFSTRTPRILLSAALLGMAMGAHAVDGTPGATSTGTMQIQVTVPQIVVIRNIQDPNTGTFDGTTDVSLNDNVCVGSNTANNGYSITATSTNGAGGNFQLNGATDTVLYNVAWADQAGQTSGTALTSGTVQNFANPTAGSNIACAADNATVVITVPAANLQAVTADTYTDTLTLTVAPL